MLTLESIINADEKIAEKGRILAEGIDQMINGRICFSEHIHYLYIIKELMGEKCQSYLEIGTLHGGSMILAMQTKYKCNFFGVDTFKFYGKEIDEYSNTKVSLDNTTKNIEKNNLYKHKFKLFKGNSHDGKTINNVKANVKKVDLLFIDGDHTERGVKKDFNDYSPLVRNGGIIMFDNYGQPKVWTGVKKGVDKLDFGGWNVIGQMGYSYVIQRLAENG